MTDATTIDNTVVVLRISEQEIESQPTVERENIRWVDGGLKEQTPRRGDTQQPQQNQQQPENQ